MVNSTDYGGLNFLKPCYFISFRLKYYHQYTPSTFNVLLRCETKLHNDTKQQTELYSVQLWLSGCHVESWRLSISAYIAVDTFRMDARLRVSEAEQGSGSMWLMWCEEFSICKCQLLFTYFYKFCSKHFFAPINI